MRKLVQFFIAAVVAVICITGCQNKTAKSSHKTLRLNIGMDPRTLDPRLAGDNHSSFLVNFLFDGLMRIDASGRPTHALAESVELSSDHLTYTFHLRDAKWSNSLPVRAQDFAFAWKSALDPNFMTDFKYQLYPIRGAKAAALGEADLSAVGIETPDSKTLIVHLDYPAPYFLEAVTHPIYFPICEKHAEAHPQWMSGEDGAYVSNGAFMFDKWKHHNELTYRRNPKYWNKSEVQMNRVVVYMVDNPIAQLDMLKNGELDWVGKPCLGLPTELMDEIRKEPGLKLVDGLGITLNCFNTKRAPMSNLNVRKAFSYAIDRRAIAKGVTQCDEVPWTSILPPALKLQKEPYFPEYAPDEARALFDQGLAELGTTREEIGSLKLIFAGNTGKKKLAETLQQQWEKNLGVSIELVDNEWKIFFDKATGGTFDIALWSWSSDLNDPIYNLEVYKDAKNSLNITNWQSNDYAKIIERSNHAFDPKKREHLLHQAEKILMSEMPVAPIVDCKDHHICSKRLQGVVISKMGDVDMRFAKLED